jgi:NhaA family Na+:H+ antiporter
VPVTRILRGFQEFARLEASGGILLCACALGALLWANSPWSEEYHALWQTRISPGVGQFAISKPLLLWINDGLMAVFFFLVGLEIKRELVVGELASPRQAAFSIAAALGGMALPAALYSVLNGGGAGARGWGIPMATDIAFALGVLALLGKRAPLPLKVFVTAFAIVDDLAAVLVIAVFYTDQIHWSYLGLAAIVLAALVAAGRAGVRHGAAYVVPGLALWVLVLLSGIHATIAGVLLALCIPLEHGRQSSQGDGLLHRMEHAVHPWVAYLILPVFALANAGVTLSGDFSAAIADRVTLGVMLGLVVGKPLGISLACWLSVRIGLASLPGGVLWRQIVAAGFLGGIGFTMSLFIGGLAFSDPSLLSAAKLGILSASFLAGLAGSLFLFIHPVTPGLRSSETMTAP